MLRLYFNIGKPLSEEDRINELWLFLDVEGFLSSLDSGGWQASEEIDISGIEIKVNSFSSNSDSIYG